MSRIAILIASIVSLGAGVGSAPLALAAASSHSGRGATAASTRLPTVRGNPRKSADSNPEVIIFEAPDGLSHFTVAGTNAEFGHFLALGEVTFVPGQEDGELECSGIAVLQASDGDQLVADVACRTSSSGFDFTFHWRDSITLSTGSVVSNTGRFVEHRPPGLVLSRFGGLKFNDTLYRCRSVYRVECGDTSCTARCFTECCLGCFLSNSPECPYVAR